MRQLTEIMCIAALLLCGCTKNKNEDAIRVMCETMCEQYPASTLQDVYKTCFQDFFGGKHMQAELVMARKYLDEELASCAGEDLSSMPEREETGFRHRFVRVNLSQVLEGKMTADELFNLFVDAAGDDHAYGDDWPSEWAEIEAVALRVHPEWADEELQGQLREAASLNRAVRHSDAFREAYHPHYRLARR